MREERKKYAAKEDLKNEKVGKMFNLFFIRFLVKPEL